MAVLSLGDGKYLHSAYAVSNIAEEFTESDWSLTSQEGMHYIGQYIDNSAVESSDPTDYEWDELLDEDVDDTDDTGVMPAADSQSQINALQDQIDVLQGDTVAINQTVSQNEVNINTASASADAAASAASAAQASANAAQQSADEAATAALDAQRSADSALTSANQARTQAATATTYANSALTQLDTVESVVDTLNWITEHSTFVATSDASVQVGKIYYLPVYEPLENLLDLSSFETQTVNGVTFTNNGDGTITVNGLCTASTLMSIGVPDVTPGETITFSGVTGGGDHQYDLRYGNGPTMTRIYDGTGTATAVASRQMYIYVDVNTNMDNVLFTPEVTEGSPSEVAYYEIVENPTGNPSAQGYYELDISDSVKTYVQTHLALTNNGLYVLSDQNGWKVLITNSSVEIQDDTGTTIANYSSSIQLGTTLLQHIIVNSNGLEVWTDNSTKVASFGSTAVIGKTTSGYHVEIDNTGLTLQHPQNGTRASFGDSAVIGSTSSGSRAEFTSTGFKLIKRASGTDTIFTDIGYETSSSTAPRYNFGTRGTGTVGNHSVVIGNGNIATYQNSFAQGTGTIANTQNQVSIGKYNKDWGATGIDCYFSVGMGSSASDRKDAFSIQDGGFTYTADRFADPRGTLTDFVVTKGTNGNWYYEKWATGKIVASFKGSVAYSSMSASGQLYRSTNNAVAIPQGIFTTTPQRTEITVNNAATVVVCATAVASSATNVNVQIWRSTNAASSVDCTIRCVYIP